jgi:hypothetical protein
MIYFIQAGEEGLIKIGCAIAPWKKIKQLQLGSATNLILLKTIPGNEKKRKEIHTYLSTYNKQGDWFYPTTEVIKFIESIKEVEYEVIDSKAYAVLRRNTETSETDPCPFCDKRHHHGTNDGHRVAHCSGPECKEELEAGNVTLRKADGYILKTRWELK